MGFFSNIFSRKKKLEEVIDEKLDARLEDFETKLFEKLAQVFGPKEQPKEEPKEELVVPLPVKQNIKSLLRVNDTITCYFNNNKYEIEGDEELWNKLLEAETEAEIAELMKTKTAKEIEANIPVPKEPELDFYQKEVQLDQRQTNYAKELIENTDDFELVNGELRMKGIALSIPGLLVDKFAELIKKIYTDFEAQYTDEQVDQLDAEYQALVNFWLWLANNPNENARKDLFKFLKKHDLRVNANGFFFTYRRVCLKDDVHTPNPTLQAFVSAEYLKVKTKWKKNTANFSVAQDEDENLKCFEHTKVPTEWDIIGNLKELHEQGDLHKEIVYTDAHTGSMKIIIGQEVRIPREQCDEDHTVECSRGLHTGNKSFGFSDFGDTSILCLINPMDVVSVPKYDSNKMRSCAYLPVAVLDNFKEEDVKFLEDADVLKLADDYLVGQVERLPKLLAGSQPSAEVAKTVETANDKLQAVANTIKSRVVKV